MSVLKFIKKQIKITEEHKNLINNFFSLGMLQVANYLLPLITIPYLVRVVGMENFGLLAFATVFTSYFMQIIDYGFNLSVTQQISINQNNIDKLSKIFSAVLVTKFILMIFSSLLMIFILLIFEKFNKDWQIYALTFSTIVGQILFPIWLFQGMEKMKYIAYLSIGVKIFFTVFIFIVIKNKNDYIFVPIINSIGYLALGFLSLYIVNKKFNLSFIWQGWSEIKYQLVEGWHVFHSGVAINFYKNNGVFIMGLFLSPVLLGYYVVARKIFEAFNGLNVVISQTFYPTVVRSIRYSEGRITKTLRLLFTVTAIIPLFFSLILYFFSDLIVLTVTGDGDKLIIDLLEGMSIAILIIGINIPAVHYLLGMRKGYYFSVALWFGAFIDLLLMWFFVEIYGIYGSIISMILTELIVTIILYYLSYRVYRNE